MSDAERKVRASHPDAEAVRDEDAGEWWISPWDDDNGAFQLGSGKTRKLAWENAAERLEGNRSITQEGPLGGTVGSAE